MFSYTLDCWNLRCMSQGRPRPHHTMSASVAVPSISIPPWAGGGSPQREQAPFEATKPRITRAPVGLLPAQPVAEGGGRDRHFHQLFRLLRLTENRTRKAGWPEDLGHYDNLLGHHRIDVLDHGHQLVHQLRLRNSKRGHHGSDVGKLLHGVPLDPLLRPRRLCQAGRPPPAGLFLVQLEEHRLGRRSLPVRVREVQLALLLPGPGLPLSS